MCLVYQTLAKCSLKNITLELDETSLSNYDSLLMNIELNKYII